MEQYLKELELIMFFLKDLRSNNNREWFAANKKRYVEARDAFLTIVEAMAVSIANFDANFIPDKASSYVFRIYRDVRFSKDKRPYKEQFGAFMANGGRKSPYAGYYLHLEADNTMAAGGVYAPAADVLKSIRMEIAYRPESFEQIFKEPEFVRHFGTLADYQLKTIPRGFPKDHKAIEWLRYKSYVVARPFKDDEVLSPDFIMQVLQAFRAMKSMNDFINQAVDMVYEK